MSTKTIKKVKVDEVDLMIQLMSITHPDFENNSFNRMAKMISDEFEVECSGFDVEGHYSLILTEDHELESRKIEYDYEGTDRFN
jgi:hypothetical protein